MLHLLTIFTSNSNSINLHDAIHVINNYESAIKYVYV
jgi:hypothetical protein